MKKFIPIIVVVGIVAFIQLSGKKKSSSSIRSNEKTLFDQPEDNKNICGNVAVSSSYLKISGKLEGKDISLTCKERDLTYHYYSDYVAERGTYEVRCKKAGHYVSMGIRNPVEKKLLRPHLPYREVPPTFNFTLEKAGKKVSQGDTKRIIEHNKESLLYLTSIKKTASKKNSLAGCMQYRFGKSGKLASGELKVTFNVQIQTK
jgi:hypothetical protein